MHMQNPEQISVKDVATVFCRHRWFILAFTIGATLAALVASFALPKHYSATVLVSPVSTSAGGSGGAVGSMLSKFGGIASLVGLQSGSGSDKAADIATLKSQVLTRRYIQKNNLLPMLYAKKWNAKTGRWRSNNPAKIPTLWQANQDFKRHIRTVTEDRKTGLYRVTITWTDPVIAATWANGLVALTNHYLRKKAISEANNDIAYLNTQAATTSIVQVKEAIYKLMEQEIRDAMIANGQREYALKVIDPAFPPNRPSSPIPWLWAVIGFLSGLLISVGVVTFRIGWSESVVGAVDEN